MSINSKLIKDRRRFINLTVNMAPSFIARKDSPIVNNPKPKAKNNSKGYDQ